MGAINYKGSNWFLDTTGDGRYDTVVQRSGDKIISKSGRAVTNHQTLNSQDPGAIEAQLKAVAESLPSHHVTKAWEGESMFGKPTPDKVQALETIASEETIGESGIGLEGLSATDIQSKNPRELAEHILTTQYAGKVPEGYDNRESFLTHLVGQMPKMAQLGKVSEKQMGFLEEERDLADRRTEQSWKSDIYGLQGQAGKIGEAFRSGTSLGSGVGIRGSIGAQNVLGKGFGAAVESKGIGMDTTDLGYRKSVYALEQGLESDYLSNYQKFLQTLPDAT